MPQHHGDISRYRHFLLVQHKPTTAMQHGLHCCSVQKDPRKLGDLETKAARSRATSTSISARVYGKFAERAGRLLHVGS
jgi:hypothetical protein